ncbi:DUF3710 domain-containing protein [Corynebacterium ulcerans]|uniref:Protein of uncharacterized function (DUF3710) n=1 Tax=Corynebacterium ulcerans TaxID=65058 RepID=A0ABD7MR50_CORUL|nr:DUF3710 domain-containing protein [Corynebacterium ulcerans]QQU25388.1 DUF3710 domain-containing protein [Corynebacterium ulcerans]SNV04259.1 Protein of uncharacterised function (DUF3710) [Corynebacterium ulcerans]SQG50427.1 Protein of uncharacterised function (DUF3710) [Corynebacterium ulcerans]SQH01782.1 Protein of uncharacterised function (DUF3710) [Corynebacterium ulcerans]
MSIWPFGKNKNESTDNPDMDRQEDPGYPAENDPSLVKADPEGDSLDDSLVADESEGADPLHDAINGQRGPFDAGHVDIEEFDFSDFSDGTLNLGSLLVPLPRPSEVQVEMGPEGPKMLHILTEHGRITPVAFAAPSSAGQWRESTKEIAAGMREDGLLVHIEHGPWGREIVGSADGGNGIIRIIGVDGPRWMLRMTLAAPAESAEQMAELGREVIARTFVNRGDAPILAGSSLPVALPQPLAEQVQEEMARRAAMESDPNNSQPPAAPSE